MNFSQNTLNEYTAKLASGEPSPGGGSAAALSGVLGVSLIEMVSNINSGRSKNPNQAESKERANLVKEKREKLMDLVTQDALVFAEVSKVWKDKGDALQTALKNAANVPFKICEITHEAATMGVQEIKSTSKHLISDLSEAGLLLKAAFFSAKLNVQINLNTIEDKQFVEETTDKLSELQEQILSNTKELIEAFEQKVSA